MRHRLLAALDEMPVLSVALYPGRHRDGRTA
jgi:hypothetical protein